MLTVTLIVVYLYIYQHLAKLLNPHFSKNNPPYLVAKQMMEVINIEETEVNADNAKQSDSA